MDNKRIVRWTLCVGLLASAYMFYLNTKVLGYLNPYRTWYIPYVVYITSGVIGFVSFLTLFPPRKVAECALISFVGSLGGLLIVHKIYHPRISLVSGLSLPANPRCSDPDFGAVLSPGVHLEADGNGFFVTVSKDFERRRIIQNPKRYPLRGEIRVLGCSFSEGVGVEDHETWPAELARQCPDIRVLNYASWGWGTTQAALRVRKMKTAHSRVLMKTLFLYGFIPDHVRRNGSGKVYAK